MFKKITIYIIFTFCITHALFAKQEPEKQDSPLIYTESESTGPLDQIDTLFSGEELPMPEFHTPSPVVVWIRSRGLFVLYKYFEFQDWVVDKCKRNIYSLKVMRYTP